MPREIFPISNTVLVVFIPNFTATHAITYTNISGHQIEQQLILSYVYWLFLIFWFDTSLELQT